MGVISGAGVMPMPSCLFHLLPLALLHSLTAAATTPREVHLPMAECEPSALLKTWCPAHRPDCLWLADNESRNVLHRIDYLDPGHVEVTGIGLNDTADTRDVEALAVLSRERILLVGSHSRKSDCSVQKRRAQFSVYDLQSFSTQRLGWTDAGHCGAALPNVPGSYGAQFCKAVQEADAKADAIASSGRSADDRADDCASVHGLNFEGAVTHADALWLGARAPLIENHAVLLRVPIDPSSGLPTMKVQALRLLDLGGRGIRELGDDGDTLWIVAGPQADATDAFELYRVDWAKLDAPTPDRLTPKKVRDLPNATEGLAWNAAGPWIAIDGDDKSPSCKDGKHQHLQLIELPTP